MNKFTLIIVTYILKLLKLSCRIKREGNPLNIAKENGYQNFCLASWHQNIVSIVFSSAGLKLVAMVSQSKDGEIATLIAKKFGFGTVRGSASRGGHKALLELIKSMKVDFVHGALTVDGPRGPKYKVKAGIVELAKQTESCILPSISYPKRHYSFRSWDNFRLPKPFTTIVTKYGTPIGVSKDLPKEEYQLIQDQIKEQLFKIEQEIINGR